MKKTLLATTLAATLIVGLSAVGAVNAAPRGGMGGGPGHGDGMGMLGAFAQLDLTEEQRTAIRTILQDFRPRIEESRSLIAELRGVMKQTVRDSGFNEALLAPIAESIGAATAQSALVHAEMSATVLAVLTPEQAELLESIFEERGDRPDRPDRPVGRGR